MEVHWRNPGELTDSVREAAEDRITRLADGHSDLIDVWVDIEAAGGHHRKGPRQVTIRCQARRAELVAHGVASDPEPALHDALEVFSREVHRLRDKRQTRR
ncbi:MAG: HPF/RaiA family ribosome-associated protein [bacterium]|nr:HPF/RaiA family ribosome-associated protein [bacterium]